MTESVVALSREHESAAAGADLGQQINLALRGAAPDALIVFASAQYDYAALLRALDSACQPKIMIGCSSAGEFTSGHSAQEGAVSAIALHAPEMRFSAGAGRNLRSQRRLAAQAIISSFQGLSSHDYVYRSALILTDALAGYTDELIEELTTLTAGTYQLFGGGAGDDGRFQETQLFYGTESFTDGVVALEILSNKPLGIGVCHAWQPTSAGMRVTEADGMRLVSLNAEPVVEVFQEHAEQTGQRLDLSNPLPFFLHNVLGIETGDGYKLRVPLGINADGSITCASDIPVGATVSIMGTSALSAADAAASATLNGLRQLKGYRPKVALFFDCVATRLRMGGDFGIELESLQQALGPISYAGFNTYGQVARAEGQFNGFHNCTAVVCIIPE